MKSSLFFSHKKWFTPLGCLALIGLGVLGFTGFGAGAGKGPAPEPAPRPVQVETLPVVREAVTLGATAYGQAQPVTLTHISPQVSGRITAIHPALDTGGRVEKGELLFEIDPTDAHIALEKARIQVALKENQIQQLKTSLERDKERLPMVQQNTALARAEHLRLKRLYEQNRVGTLSAVESAKNAHNSLVDSQKSLEKTIALYPLKIAEAAAGLADAKADVKTAQTRLQRSRVTAPFSGRIKSATLEKGSYVTPGSTTVVLADDRELEIQVPLSDQVAFQTLGLTGSTGRINQLDLLMCSVAPVMDTGTAPRPGRVNRMVKYDADSRTLYLAVRVAADGSEAIPLLDGMFCRVILEGDSVVPAVAVPAKAVNGEDTVFVSRNRLLKPLKVDRLLERGNQVYVSGDFLEGDEILISAPANILPDTLLTPVAAALAPDSGKGA